MRWPVISGHDQLPPTPTEHWVVDAQHRLHVTAGDSPSPDCVARGTTHTSLGYGSISSPADQADTLDRVLNVLDERYPNHRWFLDR